MVAVSFIQFVIILDINLAHYMASHETIELIGIITTQLNGFFSKISSQHYQFENTTELKKNEVQQKAKLLKKAYRLFKKQISKDQQSQNPSQHMSDATDKEKEKIYLNQWQQLSQTQKMKYLDGIALKKTDKKVKKKKADEDFKPNE